MAAHDEINLYAGLRSPVQFINHQDVIQRVHLRDYPAIAMLPLVLDLVVQEFDKAISLNISRLTNSIQSPYLKDNFEDFLQTVKTLK